MLSRINLKAKAIWKKMTSKEYRDAFIASYNSGTIAGQISAMRQARGWTQTQLADKCGMRQPRISALEDPDFENVELATLQRIASACDVGLMVAFVPFSEIAWRSTSLKNSYFNVAEFSADSSPSDKEITSMPKHFICVKSVINASIPTILRENRIERFIPLEGNALEVPSVSGAGGAGIQRQLLSSSLH